MKIRPFIFALLLLSTTAFAQQPGLAFLTLNPSAAGTAIGAYTASGTGLSSIEWNPAGLVDSDGDAFSFSHISGIEGTGTEQLAYVWKKSSKRAFAISVLSNNIDNIEFRSGPSPTPDGIFSAHDFYTGITYAARYGESIQYGLNGRYLYQKIYTSSASGFSLDFGLRYVPVDKAYSFGAAFRNIGSISAFESVKSDLPALIRVGGAYKLNMPGNKNALTLSGDVESILDGDSHIYIGADYAFSSKYHLRGGYASGFDSTRLTAGCGMNYKRYNFDYSFTPDYTSFANQHIFSFGIAF